MEESDNSKEVVQKDEEEVEVEIKIVLELCNENQSTGSPYSSLQRSTTNPIKMTHQTVQAADVYKGLREEAPVPTNRQ